MAKTNSCQKVENDKVPNTIFDYFSWPTGLLLCSTHVMHVWKLQYCDTNVSLAMRVSTYSTCPVAALHYGLLIMTAVGEEIVELCRAETQRWQMIFWKDVVSVLPYLCGNVSMWLHTTDTLLDILRTKNTAWKRARGNPTTQKHIGIHEIQGKLSTLFFPREVMKHDVKCTGVAIILTDYFSCLEVDSSFSFLHKLHHK